MIAGASPIEPVAGPPALVAGPRTVGCQLPGKSGSSRVWGRAGVATGVFGAAGSAAIRGLAHDRKRSEHGNRT